jgi:type IV secretory pathway VirB3-like protein
VWRPMVVFGVCMLYLEVNFLVAMPIAIFFIWTAENIRRCYLCYFWLARS